MYVKVLGGATWTSVKRHISPAVLGQFRYVNLALGTNMLHEGSDLSNHRYCSLILEAVEQIWSIRPEVMINISLIIPRVDKDMAYKPTMNRLNLAVKTMVNDLKLQGVASISFSQCTKMFLHSTTYKPLHHLYAKDGLHLSQQGGRILLQSWIRAARRRGWAW